MGPTNQENPAEIFFAAAPEGGESSRRSVLLLRWLVIIAASYLVLFTGESDRGALIGGLLVGFILSNVLLHFVPPRWLLRTGVFTAIVLFDSTVISIALLLTPGIQGDIFILYFFVILLAAVGGSFSGIVIAVTAISLLYLVATGGIYGGWDRILRTDVLLRIPFIFCVGIFYGYLSEGARRERARAEIAEFGARAKTQLFSMLTHDISNNLGTIAGFAEVLLEYTPVELPPRVREILQRIQTISLDSGQLISNLLDAARIEGGGLKLVFQPLQVGWLLSRVAQRYEARASLKKIQLDISVPEDLPRVQGDELHLDRVFANLLSNAVKFTPEGGHVIVRVSAEDASVRIEVEDSGPGIPPAEREKLFHPYQQTDSGLKAGGAGLGLYVVRTVLEAHRARVEIDDATPSGAVFRVIFPAAQASRT